MDAKERRISRGRGRAPAERAGRITLALRGTRDWAKRQRAALMGCALLIALALSCLHLAASRDTAQVTLSLQYEQAAQGLAPNGARLSLYEIKSSEVMERAIAYAGLTGRAEPQELADCLVIRPASEASVSGERTFICTAYTITLNDRLHLPGRSAEAMLSLVCKAYKDVFYSRYVDKQTVLDVSDAFFEADDDLMQLELIRIKANQLARFVNDRLKENKNFSYGALSFSSLYRQLDRFVQYDVANLSAYLLENGIARDREGLLAMLDYRIRMNTLRYDRAVAASRVDSEAIRLYDEAMSAVVMIPTTDADGGYYMSRTQTGMDDFAAHADEKLEEAAQVQAVIAYDRYVSGKLAGAAPRPEAVQKADAMIRAMQARLQTLAAQIRQVDDAYVRQTRREYISFEKVGVPALAALDPAGTAAGTLAILAAVLFGRFVLLALTGGKGA